MLLFYNVPLLASFASCSGTISAAISALNYGVKAVDGSLVAINLSVDYSNYLNPSYILAPLSCKSPVCPSGNTTQNTDLPWGTIGAVIGSVCGAILLIVGTVILYEYVHKTAIKKSL
jgi:hypothetical protein